MKKLLVTGASGFLGWNICREARAQWEVTGLFMSRQVAIDGVSMRSCDITDFAAVKEIFNELKPLACIHAAAAASPEYCEVHPEESRLLNVEASVNIASLCSRYGVRCAFTSSDLVFNGTSPPYSETFATNPISLYGKQKVEAEKLMCEIYPDMLVCRMPLMFGDAHPFAKSFIQPLINNMLHGKSSPLFIDEFRTPVSGSDAAMGILCLLEKSYGIFHLGGKTSISRYDFGLALAECLGADKTLVRPVCQRDLAFAAPRPADVSFDSFKAFALGYNPDEPEEALKKLECVKKKQF